MRVKFYILLVAILFVCPQVFAQSGQYQFSQLNINNGLSHNQVNCIFKDAKGFMWFGTMAGLNRYDGYTFKVFKHDANNKNSLNDDYIQSIYEGPGQNLWILTRNGYSIYNPTTEQFENDISPWINSLKLPNVGINKIKKDSKGNFWFIYGGNLGVYKYNPVNGQTTHYGHKAGTLPSF